MARKHRIRSSLLHLGGGLGLLAVTTSCPLYTDGEFFFVRNEGADLPVWVRGNIDSGTFIVWTHGGPGGSGLGYGGQEALAELEDDYALVFWDQRMSGVSQGNPDESTLTPEQFIDDTDVVLDVIRARYDPDALFLAGHSWGGTLTAGYLGTSDHQDGINGWIEIDGGHDMPLMLGYSLAWLDDHAVAEIDDGNRVSYWESARVWIADHPNTGEWGFDGFLQWDEYINESGAHWYGIRPDPTYSGAQYTFVSFMSLAAFMNPARLGPRFNILELSFSEEMENITIPALIMWGKHDGISPPEMAEHAYTQISTPDPDKRIVIFEESAHEPFAEEPGRFEDEVRAFVESYR